ncbi:MAG: hypothetical protein H0U16_07975 [Actinobacteria bacterium]|nr:hypothetical protein [Actinomycetota bacterium]
MTERERRLIDRILDPSYTRDVGSRPLEELRTMREECKESETELSFERRLCHARIDILTAELERRETGGRSGDLLARLPQILADEESGQPHRTASGLLPERAPDFSTPRSASSPRRRVDDILGEGTLARLPKMPPEEITVIIASLDEHERMLSGRRKDVHEVMDSVQSEIVRRYTSGEVHPSASAR